MNSTPTARFRAIVLGALLLATAFQERALAASPFNGIWRGVYYTYPTIFSVELNVQPGADGAFTGRMKFSPAVQDRNAFGQAKGSYQISGRYDEATRTFMLQPGEWIERSNQPGGRAPISGVFDAGANRLAGVFELRGAPNPIFLIAAPDAEGAQMITEILRSAAPVPAPDEMGRPRPTDPIEAQREALEEAIERMSKLPNGAGEASVAVMRKRLALLPPRPEGSGSRAGGSEGRSNWTAPSVEKFQEWAAQLKAEVPALDWRNTTFDKLYLSARNLFEDAAFKPYFGIGYTGMTAAQRKAVVSLVTSHEHSGMLHEQFLGRAFSPLGEFGAPDITVSIYWQRSMRAWLNDAPTLLRALPEKRDSFGGLKLVEANTGWDVSFLWPKERTRFANTLAGTRTRLALPVLNDAATQLIAGARDVSGAHELARWDQREKELLAYVSPADRAQLQQRIDVGLDHALEQLMATELGALAGLGHGVAAAEGGTRWYQRVAQTYEFAINRVPVQQALNQFKQTRPKILSEAVMGIIAKVDAATTPQAVRDVMATYLSCPGDEATDAGRTIRGLAEKRMMYVKEQEQLARFSPAERELMDAPGHLDLARLHGRTPPAPTVEEVRLALLRGHAFGTGELIDPHTAKTSSDRNAVLKGAGAIVHIDHVKIRRFAPEGDSYWVEYTAEVTYEIPKNDPFWNLTPDFRRGAEMALQGSNVTAKLLSEEPAVQQFRLYSDGWGVPEMRERGAANAGLDAMLGVMMEHHPH